MICPKCGENDDYILASIGEGTIMWRDRSCKACGHTWMTSEMEDEHPKHDSAKKLKDWIARQK